MVKMLNLQDEQHNLTCISLSETFDLLHSKLAQLIKQVHTTGYQYEAFG